MLICLTLFCIIIVMRLKIGAKLMCSFFIVGMTFFAFAGYSFLKFQHLQRQLIELEVRTYPALDLITRLLTLLKETEKVFQEAVEHLDPKPLDRVTQMVKEFQDQVRKLEELTNQPQMSEIALLYVNYAQLGQGTIGQYMLGGNLETIQKELVKLNHFAQLLKMQLENEYQAKYQALKSALVTAKKSGEEMNATIFNATAIALVFGILIAMAITRNISKPIDLLVEATRRIGEGDLSVKLNLARRDEFGDLAKTFNNMVDDLKRLIEKEKQLALAQEIAEAQRKRAAELEEINKKLKEMQLMLMQAGKMAAVGQMGAGIAHELNQPLTAIRGYTQLMLEEFSPEEPRWEHLKLIEEQTTRMMQIVNNVRRFSRMSRISLEPVDVYKPIEDAFMLLSTQLKNHQIEVIQQFDKELPKVMGDADQLQQVFINLITNARDALDGKGGGNIWIRTQVNNGMVEISFKNDGPLIAEDVMSHIFEPFFTTKPPELGTGLGLSISQGIVKDHKGVIKVANREGEGVEFVISLPTASVA